MNKHRATQTIRLEQRLKNELAALPGSASEIIRGLLSAYVDGEIEVKTEKVKPVMAMTTFTATPELLDAASEKAAKQGLTFNRLIVELLKQGLLGNKHRTTPRTLKINLTR